jgi:hypothetical protein
VALPAALAEQFQEHLVAEEAQLLQA